MGLFRDLSSQLKRLWNNSNPTARGVYGVAAVAALCVVVVVGWWSSRPQYIPLAVNLDPAQTGKVISQLESAGIAYELNHAGDAVLVPKQQYNKANMLTSDLVTVDQRAPEPTSDPFGASDPSDVKNRLKRLQEDRLAQAIQRMDSVASATVLIGQPEYSPFIRERELPTASVLITPRAGIGFSSRDASAIAQLVAGSVEGLNAERVTITDNQGRVWTGDMNAGLDISGNLASQRAVEEYLASLATRHLAAALGDGRSVVTVRADMDFSRLQESATTYDPDGKVVVEETINTLESKGMTPAAAGVAGTSSNTASSSNANSATQQPGSESTSENLTKKYETGFTERSLTETPGKIKRLSISASVDLTPAEGETPPELDQAAIEDLIKAAVGFDTERNDQITVKLTRLAGQAKVHNDLLVMQKWEFYTNLARSSSLGIASLVALVFGMLTFRKLRPLVQPARQDATVSAERLRILSEFTQRARENPDAMKAVISTWLNQTENSQEKNESKAA